MTKHVLKPGRGAGNRRQHVATPPAAHGYKSHATNSKLQVQSKHFVAPHFPFQPLPTPLGKPPFRFDLSELLHQDEVDKIAASKYPHLILSGTSTTTKDSQSRRRETPAHSRSRV
jgi:hypothetical protein